MCGVEPQWSTWRFASVLPDTDGSKREADAADAGPAYCVLLAAISPNPRERCVVGPRVHRMDERGAGAPTLPWTLSASDPRRPRLLRSTPGRDPGRAGSASGAERDRGFLLLPLLVLGETDSRAPVQ